LKKSYQALLLICLGALILRLFVARWVEHPGVGDPNHYYNLGQLLVEGRGFNIDYIWQFNNPPETLEHPDDYWMPLTGVIAAAGMKLLGVNVFAAILPTIILGSIVPILAYAAARQFGCIERTSLFAAACAAVLPEFVLNSVRTDTTIPNIIAAVPCILLFNHGLRTGKLWAFATSGVLAGVAYLIRSDSALLVPVLGLTWGVYFVSKHYVGSRRASTLQEIKLDWRPALLTPILAALVVAPWIVRNLQLSGVATTPNLDQMFYLTDFREHFVYDSEISLQTLLEKQTPAQILGKRLFEMAASLKIIYTTLDVFLPVAVFGGLLLLLAARDRERWLTITPALLFLAGVYLFYTLLVPLKSEGGSFKKAYLSLIPLLLPLAAYALERAIADRRIQLGVMALAVLFTGFNAVELVREDARFAGNYLNYMRQVVQTAAELPDTNGDGEIILMAQDPFMLRFVGVRAVMVPMEDRDTVLEVARRYGTDYLMMPPDRPSLDPLFTGDEADPRFVHAADVPGYNVSLFGFDFDAGETDN
jgi:hypothetical protein